LQARTIAGRTVSYHATRLSFYVRSELGIRFLDLTALRFLLDTPALTKHERSGTRR